MTDVVSVDCGEAPIENVALALELLKDVDVSAYSIPNHESKIFKDECMFCYTSPYHPGMILKYIYIAYMLHF